ncbi:MAG: HlyD family efflux transporter periplasmic adaptor subunit [Chloroflexota bacterium]
MKTRHITHYALRIFFLILLFVLAGCALESISEPRRFDPAQEPTPVPTSVAVSKPTYTVSRGTVTRELTLSGRVVPITELSLSFDMAGQIAEIFVERGQTVEEGELLAKLDTADFERDLVLAESALGTAQARLEAVETQIANERRRAEIRLEAVQIQLDYARSQVEEAATAAQERDIKLLELDVELAELALSELTAGPDPALQAAVAEAELRVGELNGLIATANLIAPWNAEISRLNLEVGQVVNVGETAVVLADLSQLEVQAVLSREADLELLTEGMSVIINPAGIPGDAEEGTIRGIPIPYGSSEDLPEGTIRIAFDSPESSELVVSNRVTIDLILAESVDTLWLPPAAVRDFSGRNFVVVQDGDTQRRVDVRLGLESDRRVEIVEGVEEDDTIIGQ